MGLLLKLKNGDTALKSLRYGNDRPGGGDSGQPFIDTSIDLKPATPLDTDGLIRGGTDARKAALTDVKRLSKYLFNTKNPSGLLFTAKQNILSRVSPKTETSFGIAYGGGLGRTIDASDAGGGTGNIRRDNESFGGINAGIYTPLSTIGQAGVGFLGTHLNKQGLDPSGLFPSAAIKKYEEVAFENNKSVNNNYQPGVPLNLYRQYLRTQRRYNKSSISSVKAEQRRQKQKYNLKQVKTPEVSFGVNKGNGLFISNPTRTQKRLQGVEDLTNNILQSSTNALNRFLIRWDNFLDKRADRIADRKYNKNQRLGIQLEGLENEMEDAQMRPNKFDNRLLNLWNTQGLNKSGIQFITSNPNILSYGGGPGSALGLGSTNIKFSTLNDGVTPARTGVNRKDQYVISRTENPYRNYGLANEYGGIVYNPTNIFGKGASDEYLRSKYNGLYSNKVYTGDDLWGKNFLTSIEGEENISKDKLQPWASDINTPETGSQKIIDQKNLQNAEPSRFNRRTTGNAGTYIARLSNSPINPITGQKRLNKKNYNKENVKVKRENGELTDFIEFTIAVQPGDKVGKNSSLSYLTFPAFIEGISDNFNADYKSINYMGRPEPFYKYSGFKRDIGFSFTVVAQSRAEIGPMYEKLNFLASTIAPSYTPAGYMTGNIAYLTIGDIYVNLPGIIDGFSFSVPEEVTWDIGLYEDANNDTQGDGAQSPMMIKVNGFKFTPLYNKIPQFGSSIWFGSDKLIDTKELLDSSAAFNEVLTSEEREDINQYLPNNLINQGSSGYDSLKLDIDDSFDIGEIRNPSNFRNINFNS
tara:strand:+ start:174 stop:2603 length:2430 start_codon:yes stop_codon:yes gene_type:complete